MSRQLHHDRRHIDDWPTSILKRLMHNSARLARVLPRSATPDTMQHCANTDIASIENMVPALVHDAVIATTE